MPVAVEIGGDDRVRFPADADGGSGTEVGVPVTEEHLDDAPLLIGNGQVEVTIAVEVRGGGGHRVRTGVEDRHPGEVSLAIAFEQGDRIGKPVAGEQIDRMTAAEIRGHQIRRAGADAISGTPAKTALPVTKPQAHAAVQSVEEGQILMAVAVEVCGRYGAQILIANDASRFLKDPVALSEQEQQAGVVDHHEIEFAVAVEVTGRQAPRVAPRAGSLQRAEVAGTIAGEYADCFTVSVGDHEIDFAVAVEIAARQHPRTDAGLHAMAGGEATVPVAEEHGDALAVADDEVDIAVVVDVESCDDVGMGAGVVVLRCPESAIAIATLHLQLRVERAHVREIHMPITIEIGDGHRVG